MKKILLIILLLLLCVFCTSCREFIEDENMPIYSESSESSSDFFEVSDDESSMNKDCDSINSIPKISAKEYLTDSTYTIIANSKTKKFHDKNCRYVSKIKNENILGFKSSDDAVLNGYVPCSICFK